MDTHDPDPRPPSAAWQAPPDRHFSLDDIIPGPILRGLVWIVRLPAGPILLALLFGLIALPSALLIPTFDMNTVTPDGIFGVAELPPLGPAVLLAALSAILGAVCGAAPIGWLIVRRHLILGGLVTICVGWIAAIVALPILPSLSGLSYGSVPGPGDPQFPQIVGIGGGIDVLTRGFPDLLILTLIVSGPIGALSLGALVLGVGIWAPLVRRRTDRLRPVGMGRSNFR
jgi:hypothetical protein